ncbi:MAG: molybdenum cofactor guanylyltransferase [Bacteroidota bacterium]
MEKNNLYGLAVCGGESSRMGMDKSLIVYHQKPQRYHVYDLLSEFCESVYISCNKKQSTTISSPYQSIIDKEPYEQIGPMAALLSAFEQFPDRNFIVIGCDYPFIVQSNLNDIIHAALNSDQISYAFYNHISEMKEPLLAIYTKECYPLLLSYYEKKEYSLQKFLRENNTGKIIPSNLTTIKSVDTPEAYEEALNLIRYAELVSGFSG